MKRLRVSLPKRAAKSTRSAGRNGVQPAAARRAASGETQRLRDEAAALREKIAQLETMQRDLERSRDRFADLFRFSPTSRLVLNSSGQILDANFAAAHLLGHDLESVVGKPLLLFVSLADRRKLFESYRFLRHEAGQTTSEFELLRRDGSSLPVQFIAARLPGSPAQGQTEYHVALTSLVEARAAEKALRESEERMRLAIGAADAALWELDLATGVLVPSERFQELLGLSSVEPMTVTSLISRLSPRQRQRAQRLFGRLLRGEAGELHGEFPIPGPKGERWLAMHGRTLYDARGGIRLVGIASDITARKEAENILREAHGELGQRVRERTAELQAANATLEREAAERRRLEREILEISEREQIRIGRDLHDGLGQEMTGAMLLNNLLQQDLATRGLPEAESAARLSELLASAKEQLRSIVRGLHPVAAEPDGLGVALETLASGVRALRRRHCTVECPEPVAVADNVVATHLFRIAQEAVNNALRHGGARRIVLRLVHAHGRILLEILDDGRGIRQERGWNRGFGLRTMRYRAEAMGGTFHVRRRSPRGTLVQCAVPDAAIHPEPVSP